MYADSSISDTSVDKPRPILHAHKAKLSVCPLLVEHLEPRLFFFLFFHSVDLSRLPDQAHFMAIIDRQFQMIAKKNRQNYLRNANGTKYTKEMKNPIYIKNERNSDALAP